MSVLNLSRLSFSLKSKRFGMSLDDLSKQIGVSKSTLSRIENKRMPDVDTYYKVCKWLGASMEDFFVESPLCFPCNFNQKKQ